MKHTIVTGLAFGDEGKGTIVDYLARQATKPLVVRHNGGSQAAHNVITPEGQHHTFSQFGSGTLAGALTHLSQFTILNPLNMMEEAKALEALGERPFNTTTIAEGALIITPYHIAANRMREDHRGDARHGSCGQGIGETVESAMRFPGSALRAADLGSLPAILDKFKFWRRVKRLEMEALGINTAGTIFDDPSSEFLKGAARLLYRTSQNLNVVEDDWLQQQFDDHDVIFEGAQGVLLDERLGFHPHTTWSNTTSHNARLLLGGRDAYHLGVTRAYTTRHGAGPFVPDMGSLGHLMFPEEHNGHGEYQGDFRIGAFDFVSLTYAIDSLKALGHQIDGLAMTHLDRIGEEVPACWSWHHSSSGTITESLEIRNGVSTADHLTSLAKASNPIFRSVERRDFLEMVETELRSEIVIESFGPTANDKKDYRENR